MEVMGAEEEEGEEGSSYARDGLSMWRRKRGVFLLGTTKFLSLLL